MRQCALTCHAAQPRMGMDAAFRISSNHQMVLRTTERDQQDVACANLVRDSLKSRLRRERQPRVDTEIAQAISARCHRARTGCRQSCCHQADAVEPACRVTSVEAEGAAHQRRSSLGERLAAVVHG